MVLYDTSLPIKSDVLPWIESTVDKHGKKGFFSRGHFKEKKSSPLCVWELPQDGVQYSIGVIATRDSYTVIHGLKIGSGVYPDTQVFEWRGKAPTDVVVDHLIIIASQYNDALVSIEVSNAEGYLLQDTMIVYGYKNLFRWRQFVCIPTKKKSITMEKVGWVTTSRTRSMLISNARKWLLKHLWEVKSPAFLEELKNCKTDECISAGIIALFCGHEMES